MDLEPGLRKVAVALLAHLNTPRSLAVYILLKNKEWGSIAAMAVDPSHYLDCVSGAEKFRRDAQASNFLRKSPLLPNASASERREQAVHAFWETEKQCYRTNQFLGLLDYPGGESPLLDRFLGILLKSRKIAKRILGPIPESIQGRFGPGTSFELKGAACNTLADKLWITPHVTQSCAPLFEHTYWPTFWARRRLELGLPLPLVTRGNRFTTVPKDSEKDRGICVEPLGNLWVQLGIGSYLKRRLSNVGILVGKTRRPDCPIQRLATAPVLDGQTLHRMLAREGSKRGNWATIDLSNASDTVAFELVRRVLPEDWFNLLCAARSPYTLIDDQWVRLDKFSSMGNGFTFELETIIFLALTAAVCDLKVGEDVFCYGDDIILPTKHADAAMAVLEMAGFTPNRRKSFSTTAFRESCGGDFFAGQPVRSVYSTGSLESPLEWMACHNAIRSHWPSAELALRRCVEQVPIQYRIFGPRRLGDSVFHGVPQRTWVEDGIRWCKHLVPMPQRIPLDRWGEEFIFTLAVLGAPSSGITPRGGPLGFRLTRTSVS